jgi:hypothetical protein
MVLEFVIVPYATKYEDYANDIEAMMRHNINAGIVVDFDKNYDESLSSRINKWKKKEYHIITVDEEYAENSYIKVRFYDKGSKTEKMTLLDFIDLVSSFEDDDETKNKSDIKDKSDDDNGPLNCIIM